MKSLHCLEILCAFLGVLSLVSAHQTDAVSEDWLTVTVLSVAVSAGVVVTLIVVLFQCGGCVGMEVSSESHPASGGKTAHPTSVVTDANTQVLISSHTLPGDDPYGSGSGGQGLPYALNPSVPSAQGFTGYQAMPTQPIPSAPGWGESGGGQTNGYRSPGPGAHRPAMGNEPPPPSYNETIRGSDALW